MHISSVNVVNYTTFTELTATFSPNLNVILGKNGSGKSNFLSFFENVFSTKIERRRVIFENRDLSCLMRVFIFDEFEPFVVERSFNFRKDEICVYSRIQSNPNKEDKRIGGGNQQNVENVDPNCVLDSDRPMDCFKNGFDEQAMNCATTKDQVFLDPFHFYLNYRSLLTKQILSKSDYQLFLHFKNLIDLDLFFIKQSQITQISYLNPFEIYSLIKNISGVTLFEKNKIEIYKLLSEIENLKSKIDKDLQILNKKMHAIKQNEKLILEKEELERRKHECLVSLQVLERNSVLERIDLLNVDFLDDEGVFEMLDCYKDCFEYNFMDLDVHLLEKLRVIEKYISTQLNLPNVITTTLHDVTKLNLPTPNVTTNIIPYTPPNSNFLLSKRDFVSYNLLVPNSVSFLKFTLQNLIDYKEYKKTANQAEKTQTQSELSKISDKEQAMTVNKIECDEKIRVSKKVVHLLNVLRAKSNLHEKIDGEIRRIKGNTTNSRSSDNSNSNDSKIKMKIDGEMRGIKGNTTNTEFNDELQSDNGAFYENSTIKMCSSSVDPILVGYLHKLQEIESFHNETGRNAPQSVLNHKLISNPYAQSPFQNIKKLVPTLTKITQHIILRKNTLNRSKSKLKTALNVNQTELKRKTVFIDHKISKMNGVKGYVYELFKPIKEFKKCFYEVVRCLDIVITDFDVLKNILRVSNSRNTFVVLCDADKKESRSEDEIQKDRKRFIEYVRIGENPDHDRGDIHRGDISRGPEISSGDIQKGGGISRDKICSGDISRGPEISSVDIQKGGDIYEGDIRKDGDIYGGDIRKDGDIYRDSIRSGDIYRGDSKKFPHYDIIDNNISQISVNIPYLHLHEQITCDSTLDSVKHLISKNYLITDTLKNAIKLHKLKNQNIITIEGDFISKKGTITGGYSKNENKFVIIGEIVDKIDEISKELDQIENENGILEDQIKFLMDFQGYIESLDGNLDHFIVQREYAKILENIINEGMRLDSKSVQNLNETKSSPNLANITSTDNNSHIKNPPDDISHFLRDDLMKSIITKNITAINNKINIEKMKLLNIISEINFYKSKKDEKLKILEKLEKKSEKYENEMEDLRKKNNLINEMEKLEKKTNKNIVKIIQTYKKHTENQNNDFENNFDNDNTNHDNDKNNISDLDNPNCNNLNCSNLNCCNLNCNNLNCNNLNCNNLNCNNLNCNNLDNPHYKNSQCNNPNCCNLNCNNLNCCDPNCNTRKFSPSFSVEDQQCKIEMAHLTKKLNHLNEILKNIDTTKIKIKNKEEIIEELKKISKNLKKYIGINKNLNLNKNLENLRNYEEKFNKLKENEKFLRNYLKDLESKKENEFMDAFEKINSNFKEITNKLINDQLREKNELEYQSSAEKDLYHQNTTNPQNSTENQSKNPEIHTSNNHRIQNSSFEPHKMELILTNNAVHIKNKTLINPDCLSTGQKTILALSLILSIQKIENLPFYFLDEIDCNLDKNNRKKIANLIKEMSRKTQYFIVTHREEFIEQADKIFGIEFENKKSIMKEIIKQDAKKYVIFDDIQE